MTYSNDNNDRFIVDSTNYSFGFKSWTNKSFFYPDEATTQYADWAKRYKAAYNNAVKNSIIVAPLTILVATLGANNEMTTIAASVYFFSRAVHFFMYTFAVPLMRTLMFLIGFAF